MGIYESLETCGCRFTVTTYSNPIVSHLTKLCTKHAPTVGNVLVYNLVQFKRRHGSTDEHADFRDIRIIERFDIINNRLPHVLIKFEVDLTAEDFAKFSNPVYYSDCGHEPSFEHGRSYLIDIFDPTMLKIS